MIQPLTHPNTRHLMESEGISYFMTAGRAGDESLRTAQASKNEVAIESLELAHEKLAAAAQGIIAVLIGL